MSAPWLAKCSRSGDEAEIIWVDEHGTERSATVDLEWQDDEPDVGIVEGYCALSREGDDIPELVLEEVAERARESRYDSFDDDEDRLFDRRAPRLASAPADE